MSTPSGAQPRNLDYYLQRMSGYSKNTIRILPQSKATYNAGDTIVFRLPTNSIIDLHTLQLKMSGRLTNTANQNIAIAYPRFTQSFFRRMDWQMGGMQTGLGSLHDYGFLYYLLASHKVPQDRYQGDLAAGDLAQPINFVGSVDVTAPVARPGDLSATTTYTQVPPAGSTPWAPLTVSSWLGLPAGNFMVSLPCEDWFCCVVL